MKKIKKESIKKFGIDLLFIFTGCAVGAFSSIAILIPNGLTSGGITGIVRMAQNFINIEFSLMYYSLAIIILILCAFLLGIKEARKIVLLTIVYPSFLFIFERFDMSLLQEKDVFLAAIYCGVFSGICTGLVFSRGYSFGGSDTIAKIIQKRLLPHVSISKILLGVDACVIIASGILFGRNVALYALITQVIVSKTVDFVMYGFESKVVQIEIITEKNEEVADFIMTEINRGVTTVMVTGEFTKTTRNKIVTLCSPREGMLIKQFVAKNDKKAFVTVIHVDTVWGRGQGFDDITK